VTTKDGLRRRYEEATQWPMVGLAALFVAAYAWGVLHPDLPGWLLTTLHVVTVIAWPVFLADYLLRLLLADDRWRFVRKNWVDGIAVVLPLLRPLRILSLIRVARVIDRRLTASLQGRVAAYVSLTSALVVFMASLAELDAERGAPEATIGSFGDALWWAFTTITTVGYGDRYPVTGQGRLVAVLLMVAGIALLGVVTAAVASWFVGRVTAAAQADDDRADDRVREEVLAQVRELSEQVTLLRAELADARAAAVTRPG
jgi:voltage-gated potassium channel